MLTFFLQGLNSKSNPSVAKVFNDKCYGILGRIRHNIYFELLVDMQQFFSKDTVFIACLE